MSTKGENSTMLTKELLKFHIRQDKLQPQFVKRPYPEELTHCLTQLEKTVSETVGKQTGNRRKDIQILIEDKLAVAGNLQEGFAKIFSDYFCEFYGSSDNILTERWNLLTLAEKLRAEKKDFLEFERALSEMTGTSVEQLRIDLYSDLADFQKLKSVTSLNTDQFINRYNVALVQGALWFATEVTISLKNISASEWRTLLQKLRYFHLLAEIKYQESTKTWTLNLSGPLALFDHVQTYAIKISNFFPHLLNLKNWKITAQVRWKNRMTTLALDEKSALLNPYKNLQSYIPEEFSSIHAAFKKRESDWVLISWGEPLHFFEGEYISPDWKAVHSSGKEVYIEIFHKWHVGGLKRRIPKLDKMKNLCVAYAKSIAKEIENEKNLYPERLLEFKDFPTATALEAALKKFE